MESKREQGLVVGDCYTRYRFLLSVHLTIIGISEICMCERDVFMWVVNAKVSALSFGCKQSAECLYADVFFMLYFSGVGLLHID